MSYSVTTSPNTGTTYLPNTTWYDPLYPTTIYPTITYVQSPCHCDCHQKHTEDRLDELITELTKLKEELAKNKKGKK